MKRIFILLVSLLAMMAAGTGLKAQGVAIVLQPGWNWIGYPYSESIDLETAFGDFVPMEDDEIKSRFGYSTYDEEDGWFGGVDELKPGWGYMYYSNRATTVIVVLHAPTSSSMVTTTEPTDITTTSAVVGGTITLPEGSHVFLRGVCWGMTPNPDIDGDHTSEEPGVGVFNSTLEGLTPGTTYYVRAYAVTDYGLAYGEELSFITAYEYVDLGLPSGTLWATCNVGANSPDDYGDYFAWGETQPKDTYSWDNYLYGNGYNQLTKYCYNSSYGYNGYTDSLTILLPEDDAAMANWGTDWRMPTSEEWDELFVFTTKTQTTLNGVDGTLFTGENGNSIFLPAAGNRHNEMSYDVGQFGYYWSNKLYNGYPSASWYFTCNPEGTYYLNFIYERFVGRSVRAVRTVPLAFYEINATAYPEEGGWVYGADTYREGAECTLTAEANEGYAFMYWTEDGEVVSTDATYTFTVNENRDLVANYVFDNGTYHEYVDLGLPSGLLWSTCNLGANLPEDYGNYYAWGETQPKDIYNWSTYQYCNGDYNTLTKYCNNSSYGYNGFTDNLITLRPDDDAATTNWGNGWRMPTEAEWQELIDNTTITWTQQNGVYGRLFTASNGNSLFLPAAGYRWDGELNSAGSSSIYWSSSLNTDSPRSAGSLFSTYVEHIIRSYGFSVRPVLQITSFVIEATANPIEGGVVIGDGTYEEGALCELTATANEGYIFNNWSENGEVVSTEAAYSFIVSENRNLVANFIVFSGYTYVDLGLPSGTLWATCNVGATTPEGYGDYFAWGETQQKDNYNWSTYQYCNGSSSTLTKYCNNPDYGYNGYTDTLTTLLPDDDAATANWGADWRMPTIEEWRELYNRTTRIWTIQNGVYGRLFTSSNGNSIFLPAAGNRTEGNLNDVGSYGYYWSSSLDTINPYGAWDYIFSWGAQQIAPHDRYIGWSVRAVRSGQN